AGGVRGNQRGAAHGKRIVKSLVGNMRDVDQHPNPIHLAHNVFAVICQTVVDRLVGGGIRPLVVIEVRESHVADTQVAVDADHADVIAEHVAAFDAHQDCNLALVVNAAHI